MVIPRQSTRPPNALLLTGFCQITSFQVVFFSPEASCPHPGTSCIQGGTNCQSNCAFSSPSHSLYFVGSPGRPSPTFHIIPSHITFFLFPASYHFHVPSSFLFSLSQFTLARRDALTQKTNNGRRTGELGECRVGEPRHQPRHFTRRDRPGGRKQETASRLQAKEDDQQRRCPGRC